MYIRIQDHILRTLKILWSMSGFGGLWKQQNNSACTKNVRSLQNAEVGHYTEDDEEQTRELISARKTSLTHEHNNKTYGAVSQ